MKDYYQNWLLYFEFFKESLEALKKDRAYSINLDWVYLHSCVHYGFILWQNSQNKITHVHAHIREHYSVL